VIGCLGPDYHPSISSRGNYLGFTSQLDEFCVQGRERWDGDRPDCPAFPDVFVRYIGPSHEGFPLG
jgi:hypothetical protein